MADELRRCDSCNRPRDNTHPHLCPICLLRKMYCRINFMLDHLTRSDLV